MKKALLILLGLVYFAIWLSCFIWVGRFIPYGNVKVETLSLGKLMLSLLIAIPIAGIFIFLCIYPIIKIIDKIFEL